MGRKARHTSRTGDGGAEMRLRKKQLKNAETDQKDAELAFYDDPSDNESTNEQELSDEDELEGEEVLELGGDDDEDDEDEEEEMDDDDEDEDAFDGGEERKKVEQMEGKWGKSRKTFYSADTAEYELESDEEVAKDEEEAALELQRKQAEMMDDEDFGIDDAEPSGSEEDEDEDAEEAPAVDDEELVGEQLADIANLADNGAGGAEDVEQVHKDFSKMSKKDKLQIVNQSAPELLGLISELEATTKELEEVVTPAVLKLRPVRRKSRPLQIGLRYLMTRQNLLLNYSANISFYLLLRAEGKSVSDHPVLMHLLLLKKQLNKMQALDEVLNDQLQDLLTKELPPEREAKVDDGLNKFFAKNSTKTERKRDAEGETVSGKKTKKHKKSAGVSAEELTEAERFYEETARDQAALKQSKKDFYTHEKPGMASGDEDSDLEGTSGKRGASYQIIKNKGLKAHKSKLNRNPRVKKRLQYRKAVIRRKGQVRDVRVGEAGKYGGETTGIKSNLTRSRKIRN